MLGFGHAGSLGPGMIALVIAGFAQNVAMISMAATLLGAAGAGYRGRVMGVRMLAVYGLPSGSWPSACSSTASAIPRRSRWPTAVGLICTVLDRSPVARQHLGARGRPRLITRRLATTRGALDPDS